MTREAVKVELTNSTGFIRRYTVADGTAIAKGAYMKLTDPRTAILMDAASAAATLPAAGIASADKEASDGSTSLGLWTDGIFEGVASGAITLGAPIVFITGNYIAQAPAVASGAVIAGYALETASDAETINFRLKL